MRHLSRSIFLFLVIELVCSVRGNALPRFALYRAQVDCSSCHLNPTGGGLRTGGGENFSVNALPMWKRGEKFNPQITEGFRIGGDVRLQSLHFSDEATYGSSNGTKLGTDTTTTYQGSQMMSVALYLDAQLTQSVSAYARYDLVTGSSGYNNYEAYGLAHLVHSSGEIIQSGDVLNDLYVKIGGFMPDYGIRFDDHTVYTRGGNAGLSGFGSDGLFWVPNYRDIGVELGASLWDHLFVSVGRFNGMERDQISTANAPDNPPAYAVRGVFSTEIVQDLVTAQIGASAYMHDHDRTLSNGDVAHEDGLLWGIHGGVRVGIVSLLAEFDKARHMPKARSDQYADHAQAFTVEGTVQIMKGLTGLLRFDNYQDTVNSLLGNEVKSRVTVGAQWFPIRFVEIRPEFRIANATNPNLADPTFLTRDEHKDITGLIQLHLFF